MSALLIENIGHLITMNAGREVLRDAWLLVNTDGFIAALGTGEPSPEPVAGVPVYDARGGIATPGLINTHHFYQTMARATSRETTCRCCRGSRT